MSDVHINSRGCDPPTDKTVAALGKIAKQVVSGALATPPWVRTAAERIQAHFSDRCECENQSCDLCTSEIDVVARLISACEPGWRPIETAQKDSKARLVWCPERRNQYVVCWNELCGWSHFGGGSLRPLIEMPSMWRPLPADPPPNEGG